MGRFSHVISLIIIFLVLVHGVYAQDCNAIILNLRGTNTAAFNEYPQLNDAKQDILLLFYSRERGTCPEDLYSLGVLSKDFIEKFDTAYRLSRSPDPEDNARAVEMAGELKESTQEFVDASEPFGVEAVDLANSAVQAIDSFLLNLGNYYALEAEKTDETRKVISFYNQAGQAFFLAGAELESASYRIKKESLEGIYLEDIERADTLFSEAEGLHDRAQPLMNGGFISRMSAYPLVRESQIKVEEANSIYQYHHEKTKIEMAEGALTELRGMKRVLTIQLAIYFTVIYVVITAVSLYVIMVLKTWNNDSLDYSLGNELVQVRGSEEY